MTAPAPDEMTELVDADFRRVDLVGKAANGTEFLVMKAQSEGYGGNAGLLEAEVVRDLIAKSDATTDSLQEASMTAPAATEAVVKEGEDLDASTVLAEPEAGASGSATMPGSPAWEATDAATARKWTAILSRAKNALGVLADREQVEDASGNGDLDAFSNSLNLSDAACAIDYAIGVLAPFAVGEQAEADLAGEGAELIAKSMAGFDTDALDVLEGFAPVVKAGRSLSAANESKIRGAVESLQAVLNSLPAATDDVAKQQATGGQQPAEPAAEDDPHEGAIARVRKALEDGQPVTISIDGQPLATDVLKAKGDPQVAVYDENGKLVGTVDQADINPIAAPAKPAGSETAPTDAASTQPAPAATVGTPAAAPAPAAAAPVAKEAAEDTIPRSEVENIVKAALAEQEAANADVLKGLRDDIDALRAPARPKVISNGAPRPLPHDNRGMGDGAPVDVSKAAELKARLDAAPDATTREQVAKELNSLAATELARLHATRPTGR